MALKREKDYRPRLGTLKEENLKLREQALENEVRELVGLMRETKPDLTDSEMKNVVLASTRYAKDLLKGKAAELYGMSLEWAIELLRDPAGDKKDKLAIVLKILGHCLPTEVTLNGSSEQSKPILFQMARPQVDEVIRADAERED